MNTDTTTTTTTTPEARWVNAADDFIAAKRDLVDWNADKLLHESVRVFEPNGAALFDLALSTLTILDRMYRRLNEIWAENHTLLQHDVELLDIQQLYRAFHRYALAGMNGQLIDLPRPTSGETGAAEYDDLINAIRTDRARQAAARNLAEELERELDNLRAEIDELTEQRRDPGSRYVAELTERKKVRARVLRLEAKRLPTVLDSGSDGRYTQYKQRLQEQMRAALNLSLLELVRLREAVAKTPELFNKLTREQQVRIAVARRLELGLPDKLLTLYVELYDLLGEATVRSIIESELVGE